MNQVTTTAHSAATAASPSPHSHDNGLRTVSSSESFQFFFVIFIISVNRMTYYFVLRLPVFLRCNDDADDDGDEDDDDDGVYDGDDDDVDDRDDGPDCEQHQSSSTIVQAQRDVTIA